MKKPRRDTKQPVELDGRTLEGGGQLIRNALCLSALTGIPVQIDYIRGNRSSGGGLKAQHLACINWLVHACSARVLGAAKGSKTLLFEPGKANDKSSYICHSPAFKKVVHDGRPVYECKLDIGTAGSTGLALQAILPFILFSERGSDIPVRLTLSGGTNVSGSPSYDYITQVLLPTLRSIGLPDIKHKLTKRGWSQGGSNIGSFTLEIPPRESLHLPAFNLTSKRLDAKPSTPCHLRALFIGPASSHQHFRTVLIPAIHHNFNDSFSEDDGNLKLICEDSGNDKRLYFILVATMPIRSEADGANDSSRSYTLGRDWLYDRKIRSLERTATEMAERVTYDLATEAESGGYVDCHMRDQLIIFQALAQNGSTVYAGVDADDELLEPSLHARTAEWVAKKMLGVRFDAEGRCEGIEFGTEENPPTDTDATQELEEQMQSLEVK